MGHMNCTEEFCECVFRLQVALNDEVEIVMIDEGVTFNANHPMHLHGHAFRVVGIGKVGFSISTLRHCCQLFSHNLYKQDSYKLLVELECSLVLSLHSDLFFSY